MGGTIVTIRRPDPELILNAIQREKVTIVSHFVPTTLLRVLDYPKVANYDLSTVRYFMYGAAPMPIPILRRAIPLLAKKFIQLYGFTEQSGAVASLSPEDHILEGTEKQMRRLSSCGKEMPSNDIRVINNRGELAASGETGEIVVRGDNLAEGYWKEPEQTNKFFKNGWYYTGDLGTYDEDKYIYITGRSKDIIISGGENITPRQVEDVIYEHPSVDMVAVIGVPDPSWGEAVIAIIVPKNGAKITEDEIIGWSKERLAHYKVPKSVYFVESLPLTTTGKIKKWVLKEKYGYL
jgi:long-chain acyl-CoA synthetase